MLASGGIKDQSTRHMLLSTFISSCYNMKYMGMLVNMFNGKDITDDKGNKVLDAGAIEVSSKHKHEMMKAIWSSKDLYLDVKKSLMKKLEESDKSDWMENTKAYCNAALPETKVEMWNKFFARESEVKDWGLHTFQHSFRGFN